MGEESKYLKDWLNNKTEAATIDLKLSDDFIFAMAILEKARESCMSEIIIPSDRIKFL